VGTDKLTTPRKKEHMAWKVSLKQIEALKTRSCHLFILEAAQELAEARKGIL